MQRKKRLSVVRRHELPYIAVAHSDKVSLNSGNSQSRVKLDSIKSKSASQMTDRGVPLSRDRGSAGEAYYGARGGREGGDGQKRREAAESANSSPKKRKARYPPCQEI